MIFSDATSNSSTMSQVDLIEEQFLPTLIQSMDNANKAEATVVRRNIKIMEQSVRELKETVQKLSDLNQDFVNSAEVERLDAQRRELQFIVDRNKSLLESVETDFNTENFAEFKRYVRMKYTEIESMTSQIQSEIRKLEPNPKLTSCESNVEVMYQNEKVKGQIAFAGDAAPYSFDSGQWQNEGHWRTNKTSDDQNGWVLSTAKVNWDVLGPFFVKYLTTGERPKRWRNTEDRNKNLEKRKRATGWQRETKMARITWSDVEAARLCHTYCTSRNPSSQLASNCALSSEMQRKGY